MALHSPRQSPKLWRRYLDGAEDQYRRFGVQHALHREEIEDGRLVSSFVVAWSGQEMVGGIRCHGPLLAVDEAYALREMAGAERPDILRRVIASCIPGGVVEIKGAWLRAGIPRAAVWARALARCIAHFMDLHSSDYGICTGADKVTPRWETIGGREIPRVGTSPYPSDDYRTVFLLVERAMIPHLGAPEQVRLLERERTQRGR